MLGLLSLATGGLLAIAAIDRASALGLDAEYLSHVLALDAPVETELGSVLGPAGDSVDNLAFILALAFTGVAATLLIVAGGFWLTSARTRHPEAARRVCAIGLWLALGISLVAILPVNAGWQRAGPGAGPGGGVNVAVLPIALFALLGLLLLQFSAQQWGTRMREAFRGRS